MVQELHHLLQQQDLPRTVPAVEDREAVEERKEDSQMAAHDPEDHRPKAQLLATLATRAQSRDLRTGEANSTQLRKDSIFEEEAVSQAQLRHLKLMAHPLLRSHDQHLAHQPRRA